MRIRDIVHASGRRLRIGLDRGSADEAMVIQLSDPERPGKEPVLLDLYGAELLAGFLMNARLATRGELADEMCGGLLGCRLRLASDGGEAAVELFQHAEALRVPQPFWDRLYAELTLALAHGRHLATAATGGPVPAEGFQRLLH
ncbi:hypothetical protein GCM10022280_03610 [Sphingomonas swuensis]|uniref:Uncharacterized protein n=1 Tax=Sphingomonas swuensis TaxID=977800 RepID=A0ABP7SCI0_9SPHN